MIKPLGKRIVIKLEKDVSLTHGGIVIPVMAQEKLYRGRIVAVHDGCKLNVGEIVMYDKYAGNIFEKDREQYLIIKVENILCVVEENA